MQLHPNIFDCSIKRGHNFVLPFTWTAGLPTPAAVDLTGASARMDIREKYTDASPLLTLTSPTSGIVITPTTGRIVVTITKAQLAAISAAITELSYDLEVIFADASSWPFMSGRFTLMPTGNP